MSCQNYCSDLPGIFTNDGCPDESGGIIAAGYIDCSTFETWVDFEDNSEWTTAIAAENVKTIFFTKGSYEGPEWETEDGYGQADEEITGGTHTCSYSHKNLNEVSGGVAVNYDFYNKIAKVPGQYYFYMVTGDFDLLISTKPVTVKPRNNIPESKKEKQTWQVEVTWADSNLTDRYNAPAAIYS